MKLYYTTINGHLSENKNPQKSLGGFRSSTKIPNGLINSLFQDVTKFGIDQNKEEYIAICLYNDTGTTVSDAKIWIETGEYCYSKFEIAAVSMPLNSDGEPQMEYVQTIYERPYTGEFEENVSEATANELGSITNGVGVGLWIRRSLLLDVINEDKDKLIYEVDQEKHQFAQKDLSKKDTVTIKISYS